MIHSTRGRFAAALFSIAGSALAAGCDSPAEPIKPGPGSTALPDPGPPDASRKAEIRKDASDIKKDASDMASEIKKEAGDKATELKKEAGDAGKKIEQKAGELKREAGAEIKKGEEALGKGLDKLEKKLEGQPK